MSKPVQRQIRITWLQALFFFLLLLLIFFHNIFLNQTILAGDTLKSIPFSQWGQEEFFVRHRIGQWIPYLFGGMPAFGAFVTTPSYVVAILFNWVLGPWLPFFTDPLAMHLFHLTLLGLGTFLWLRQRHVDDETALLTATAMVFMPTLLSLTGVGHTIKLWTFCYVPLVLLMFDRVLEKPSWKRLLQGGLVFSLMLQVHHLQIAYYFLLAAGILYLVQTAGIWRRDRDTGLLVRRVAALAGAVLTGFLLTAFLYLQVANYSKYSMRSSSAPAVQNGQYAASYSYPPQDLETWLTPSAKGFGGGNYWGGLEYTAFPLYMGVIPLFLALWALIMVRRRETAALGTAAFLLLLVGMGSHTGPFFKFLLAVLPFFGKFRAHMWAIGLTQILLMLLAGYGLKDLLERRARVSRGKAISRLHKGTVVVSALSLVVLVFAQMHLGKAPTPGGTSFLTEQDPGRVVYYFQQQGQNINRQQLGQVLESIRTQRSEVFYTDLRTTALIVFLAALGFLLLLTGKLPRRGWLLLLLVLILGDAWRVNHRAVSFQPRTDTAAHFRPNSLVRTLQEKSREELFRVYPVGLYGYNELVYWRLQSISGYHGAKLKIIQDLLDNCTTERGTLSLPVLDILNVHYALSTMPLPGFREIGREQNQLLLERENPLPRWFFPDTALVLPNYTDILKRLRDDGFDPRRQLLLLETPPVPCGHGEHRARLVDYDAVRIELEVENSTPTLLAASEIYYPAGWRATVDGKEVPILQADYAIRAIPLETAGKHRVVMEFKPLDYRLGKWISLLTLLLVVGGLAATRK